jgi:hypothetical protein
LATNDDTMPVVISSTSVWSISPIMNAALLR